MGKESSIAEQFIDLGKGDKGGAYKILDKITLISDPDSLEAIYKNLADLKLTGKTLALIGKKYGAVVIVASSARISSAIEDFEKDGEAEIDKKYLFFDQGFLYDIGFAQYEARHGEEPSYEEKLNIMGVIDKKYPFLFGEADQ